MKSWYTQIHRWWVNFFLFRRWPILAQLTKFALIGVSSFIVDMLVYVVLTRLTGLYYLLANILSFLISAAWSFYWNKRWTFRTAVSQPLGQQYFKFLSVNIVGLFLTSVLLFIFVSGWSWNDLLAKFIIAIIVMLWNFSLNKIWTFR
ncbi:MAG: GtrA family protein [Candidatus Komeilibacteria bacterium]